jgi:hypothetical protein
MGSTARDGTYIVVNTEMKCRMYRVNETPRAQRRDDATVCMYSTRAAEAQAAHMRPELSMDAVVNIGRDVYVAHDQYDRVKSRAGRRSYRPVYLVNI